MAPSANARKHSRSKRASLSTFIAQGSSYGGRLQPMDVRRLPTMAQSASAGMRIASAKRCAAIDSGRSVSRRQGTEFRVHNKDGRIAGSDSHGGDPYPPKG